MKKTYFTMFSAIMYGYPDKTVAHCKMVAKAETCGQAKYLCSLLNRGKKAA